MTFYITVLWVYFGIYAIASLGLNLQFGVTGVLNLGFIVELAIGSYVYAICTLGPDSGNGGFQRYFLGAHLPPVVAVFVAMAIGGVAGVVFGLVGLRKLRPDYQAIVLLVVAVMASVVASADQGLLNGNAGLTLIPSPLGGDGSTSGWSYVVLVSVVMILMYLAMRRLTDGPLGRSLRAVRDDPRAASAIGKHVVGLRLTVQGVGGVYAALAGALLAGFIGAWSPSSWQYVETLVLLTGIVVGGAANNRGVVFGALLVPVLLLQGAQFLPPIAGKPGGAEDLGWIITGLLTIAFLWWRPRGLVPDRRPRYARADPSDLEASVSGPAVIGSTPGSTPAAADPARDVQPLRSSLLPAGVVMNAESEADGVTRAHILEVSGLTLSFGGVHAVDDVTFRASRGAVTGLIGPNGAGKSSVINLLSGMLRSQSGRVIFDGTDISRWGTERRARAGLVRTFQSTHEFAGLTTIENLLVAPIAQPAESALGVVLGRYHWGEAEERNLEHARMLLDRFEMHDKVDDLAGSLSGGQRRMVELMRALMTRPRLLLLDEPLAGLSQRWCHILEETLVELRRDGLSMILVEHELGIVERVCDSVIVMANGRVLTEGKMEELRDQEEVRAAYVIG